MDVRHTALGMHQRIKQTYYSTQSKQMSSNDYGTNDELHDDLAIKRVNEVIQDYAAKHKRRLLRHTNVEAIQLLDNSQEIRRLKRIKPYELIK